MDILLIHSRLANTGILYSAAVGLWALYLAFRRRGLDSNFWGALVINEIVFIVEAALGVTMWAQGLRPARVIHILYGVVAVITIPAAFAFTRGQATRREAMLYGFICLFLAGIAIRAATTAALTG